MTLNPVQSTLTRSYSHAIGFDDGPFLPAHRGDVDLIGAVFSGPRLDGLLRTRVRRDGANATERIAEAIERSRFFEHVQLVLLQGIAVAGFNVVDIHALNERLGLPVIAVARRRPDMEAVRRALLESVPGGRRKWRLVERAGPPQNVAGVWLQRAGIALEAAAEAVSHHALYSRIPEPLRVAHLIAGGISELHTHQRV
ncbi:MAG: DUF99 family protein [Pseudomonadota bacterium]|nr:DUF99 family protein [Pseudomonadota bacterium]